MHPPTYLNILHLKQCIRAFPVQLQSISLFKSFSSGGRRHTSGFNCKSPTSCRRKINKYFGTGVVELHHNWGQKKPVCKLNFPRLFYIVTQNNGLRLQTELVPEEPELNNVFISHDKASSFIGRIYLVCESPQWGCKMLQMEHLKLDTQKGWRFINTLRPPPPPPSPVMKKWAQHESCWYPETGGWIPF